ncbi:MAG TPA: hypothetical protein VK595_10315 [Vicinamibacterales bacterium]|nr:hypothetical protein [Vicinamibacterales bacterium]
MRKLLAALVVLLVLLALAFATGTIGGRQGISDLEQEIAEATSAPVSCQPEDDSGRVACFGTVDSRPALFEAERDGDQFTWQQTR